jgi:hypothetical protein
MKRLLLPMLVLLVAATATEAPAQPRPPRQPEMLADAPGLHRRIIVRPGAQLAQQPAANAPSAPVPGFSVFYVYGSRSDGQQTWLEVGPALDGRTVGWLPEVRTIAWRQNMVVAFTNPRDRQPAMFFRDGARRGRRSCAVLRRPAVPVRYLRSNPPRTSTSWSSSTCCRSWPTARSTTSAANARCGWK